LNTLSAWRRHPSRKRGIIKDIHPHPFPPPSKGEEEGGGGDKTMPCT